MRLLILHFAQLFPIATKEDLIIWLYTVLLYDAKALEVIGIEGIKKESDASGEVYGKAPEARATSNSDISIAELLKLVKGDAEKYIPKTSTGDSTKAV